MRSRRGPILALLLGLASCARPDPGPRLLLLITVDTLRADRLGAYGSDRGLTPHLDALAEKSLVFTSTYAPSSHTLPSIVSIFTGRYPEELGVWSNLSVVPPETPTLAKRFRDAGWNTSAVVSSWVLREASGLAVGFGTYDDELPQMEATRPYPERIGGDTTRAALAALDACLPDAEARCFLWVHFQDPHGPYAPPEHHRKRLLAREREAKDGTRQLSRLPNNFGPGGIPIYPYLEGQQEVAWYRAGYNGEIAYLDESIGTLLAGLSERGLEGTSAIVFTADHGESLGENDYWFAHGELLTEELARVPLLVHLPDVAAGRRDELTGLVDLWPTLTQRLLPGSPTAPGPGRALLEPGAEARDTELYMATLSGSNTPRFGLIDPEFKYIASQREGVWDSRLTKRGQDAPDLTAPAPQLAGEMRERLIALMDRYRIHEEESRGQTSESDLEQLKALGYVDRAPEP